MKEEFLQFIWKFKLFDQHRLKISTGKELFIVHTGRHNFNTGPDFFNARIWIDNQLWAGNVEIHQRASDWYAHRHEKDPNYDSVILHVVWEYDVDIFRKDNSVIPTLELKDIVQTGILENYQKLFKNKLKWINCEKDLASVEPFHLDNWIERLFFERLMQKSLLIEKLLKESKNNWEEVLFKLLAKSFGSSINGEAFLDLANSMDFKIVRKESVQQEQLEALLFGQAGLLNETREDPYYRKLGDLYVYLKVKYDLNGISENQIQYFRIRPSNFPTIRLSQLANLFTQRQNLFTRCMQMESLASYYELFSVGTSAYWEQHYTFGKIAFARKKRISKSFIDLLLINAVIPLKFIYLKHKGALDKTAILSLISELRPEKNAVIQKFAEIGVKANNAFESQSLLQLKQTYCDRGKCLSCQVGVSLLKH